MTRDQRLCSLLLFSLLLLGHSAAQHVAGYNYDEAAIPPYTALDPLKFIDGRAVSTPQQWAQQRRPEVLSLFERNVFGRTPDAARYAVAHARVLEHNDHALDGLAIREQIELSFDPAPGMTPPAAALHTLRLLLYVPAASAAAHRPSPVVLGPNFNGNQAVVDDPGIQPTPVWSKPHGSAALLHELPADATRGSNTQQWQVRLLLQRGYALATFYYGDLEPDFKDAEQFSVRTFFQPASATRKPDNWGALGVWAWGLSRALDYLALDPLVDVHHVAVTGHSRLGKAADWAAAQDERFAAVLSTESGHGGQSLQRRALGETVAHLQHSFPYWFAPAYGQWVGHDAEIPADGNLLLSLLAPRPVYVASAQGDEWSDPRGEFLASVSASKVYRLLGQHALAPETPYPAVDHPVGLDTEVAYHVRSGKHDVTAFDWEQYLDFLDRRWGKPLERAAVPPTGLQPPPAVCGTKPRSPGAKSTAPCPTPVSAKQVTQLRTQVRQALFIPEPLPVPDVESYGTAEIASGVTLERLSFRTAYGLRVPALVYRPTHAPAHRMPALVVVNGHGGDKTSWYAYYTGVLYARAGAVVLTYDPIGEGERNDEHKDFTGQHDALVSSPASMPARLGGLMVTDAMQAVSTLRSREDVDPDRIGVMGFSMGSFIASLTGAADSRIHALLLVGGGDLDGPGGYWDAGHAVMCQAAPYKGLQFLGDRGAVLFTLSARRGDTLILNGTADTVVAIPTHGPEFFEDLRQRTLALNGKAEGVFTTRFDPGASHRPSWMTPAAAAWLDSELRFPNWRDATIDQLPTIRIGDWAEKVSFALGESGSRTDRDAGIQALAADVPLLDAATLSVLPRAEWESRKTDFVYSSWVTRAAAAAAGISASAP